MQGVTGYTVGIAVILTLQFSNIYGELSKVHLLNGQRQRHHQSKNSSTTFTLEDGEQIALEVTNQLLPPPELSEKISQELKLIKYKYRAVSKITHQRKWIPGQLITTKITHEQVRLLNASEFGPLLDVTTVDLLPFYIVTILSFGKPYNPLALGEMLSFQYGFSSSPNTVYFDGDDIFYDLSTKTYIFKRRGPVADCKAEDCRHTSDDSGANTSVRYYWEFVVEDSGNVRLIKEYEIDSDGNKELNSRYGRAEN